MNCIKRCTGCQEDFPATTKFFRKHSGGKYGLSPQCKECAVLRDKKYREENRLTKKESSRKWRQKNPDYNKLYYKENEKKVKDTQKVYRSKNPGVAKANTSKRKASILKQTPVHANINLIEKIYHFCPAGYNVDHMTPLANGGLHHESNLCYLPESVNKSKGSKSILA